jgi:predicted NBD/HSP70 family sugar kinase
MEYFAAIDVSLELSSVCVVDGTGKIVREAKIASEPDGASGKLVEAFGAGAYQGLVPT